MTTATAESDDEFDRLMRSLLIERYGSIPRRVVKPSYRDWHEAPVDTPEIKAARMRALREAIGDQPE